MHSYFLNWPAIAQEQGIRREQRDAFNDRLSNKQSIERIPMNYRQRIRRERVLTEHGQLVVPIVQETLTQRTRVDLKVGPIEAAFDGDFPQACDAVDEFICLFEQDRLSLF